MLYHCGGGDDENHTYDYIIKVDSVLHPRSVLLNDTISLKFYGKIGTWESQVFRSFGVQQFGDSLKIQVIGTKLWTIDHAKSTYLNGLEKQVLATQRGVLHLVVLQPAGIPAIEDSIIVN